MTDLPKWRSHKIVQADKIDHRRTSGTLVLESGAEIDLLDMAHADLGKRLDAMMPMQLSGGYYVRYEDGYESWSPAKAFEEGYTRVDVDKDMPESQNAATDREAAIYGTHNFNWNTGVCECGATVIELEDNLKPKDCPALDIGGPSRDLG
jgi:hypothetical protein